METQCDVQQNKQIALKNLILLASFLKLVFCTGMSGIVDWVLSVKLLLTRSDDFCSLYCVCVCACVCVCVCVRTCMHLCVCVYMRVLSIKYVCVSGEAETEIILM